MKKYETAGYHVSDVSRKCRSCGGSDHQQKSVVKKWPDFLQFVFQDGTRTDGVNFTQSLTIGQEEYILASRIMAANVRGGHFYTFFHSEKPTAGTYWFDDSLNNGYARRLDESGKLYGAHKLSVLVTYVKKPKEGKRPLRSN